MTIPLMILMIGAVIAGLAGVPGQSLFEHWLEPVIGHAEEHVSAVSPLMLTAVATLAALIGAFLGMSMYDVPLFGLRLPRVADPARVAASLGGLYAASFNKFGVDELYDRLLVRPFKSLARTLWRGFDQGVIDGIVDGAARSIAAIGTSLRGLQTGYMRSYAVSMLLGVVVLILWFFFR